MVNDWLVPAADLGVGVAFAVLAVLAGTRSRGAALLAVLVVLTWAAGSVLPEVAPFWHRGPLIHLLLTFPVARPDTRLTLGAVIVGYVAALVPGVWGSDGVALVLAVALAVSARAGSGRARKGAASAGTVLLGVTIAGGVVVRAVVTTADAIAPVLVAYCTVLMVIAAMLVRALLRRQPGTVSDLVVELAERPSPTLAQQLGAALGDPKLRVGYWDREAREFRTADGSRIPVPPDRHGDRAVTVVDRGGSPFAALAHHRAVADDPELVESIRHLTLLTAANDALRQDLRASAGEVDASRRRLLVAEDDERRRLSTRLADEVADPLAAVRERIEKTADHDLSAGAERVLSRLVRVSAGLHPAELDGGLAPAIEAVVRRNPVPVELEIDLPDGSPGDPEIERAAYYLLTEALTNVGRHAAATSVQVSVSSRGPGDLLVRVADDGAGGADPSFGSGLAGLADRVAAVGGALRIDSARGDGTVVVGRWPASQSRAIA